MTFHEPCQDIPPAAVVGSSLDRKTVGVCLLTFSWSSLALGSVLVVCPSYLFHGSGATATLLGLLQLKLLEVIPWGDGS